jgi:hypothetical protein
MVQNLIQRLEHTESALEAAKEELDRWSHKSQGTIKFFENRRKEKQLAHCSEKQDRLNTVREVWGPQPEAGYRFFALTHYKDDLNGTIGLVISVDDNFFLGSGRIVNSAPVTEIERSQPELYQALTRYSQENDKKTFIFAADENLGQYGFNGVRVKLLSKDEIENLNHGRSVVHRTLIRHSEEERKIEEGISWLHSRDEKVSERYNNTLDTLEEQASTLRDTIELNQNEPKITWGRFRPAANRGFYSLFSGTDIPSPVFLYEGGIMKYLITTRKNDYFKIEQLPTFVVMRPEVLERSKNLIGLTQGNFCDSRGLPLVGKNHELADKIFHQVRNGVVVLPDPEQSSGYRVRIKKEKGGREPPKPRHWGQGYLQSLNPEKVTPGKLLGSGHSYKAYVFGDRTVVEFDEENRATYFFGTDYFESLRAWNRNTILRQDPEGFDGRTIHKGDQEAWKLRVEDYLTRSE